MTYFHIRLMSWNDALKMLLTIVLCTTFSVLNKDIFTPFCAVFWCYTWKCNLFFFFQKANKIINVLQTVAFSKYLFSSWRTRTSSLRYQQMIYRKPSGFVKFTAGFNCSHVNLNSCEHCQQNNYSKPPGTVKKKKKKVQLITPIPA